MNRIAKIKESGSQCDCEDCKDARYLIDIIEKKDEAINEAIGWLKEADPQIVSNSHVGGEVEVIDMAVVTLSEALALTEGGE